MNKCTVRVRDSHGSEHCAIVYAESLYEAAIRGLNMLEHVGWESDRDETIKSVEVEVHHEPTRHTVDVPRLLKLGSKIPLCLCLRHRTQEKQS